MNGYFTFKKRLNWKFILGAKLEDATILVAY
jgi:hypothetical protein